MRWPPRSSPKASAPLPPMRVKLDQLMEVAVSAGVRCDRTEAWAALAGHYVGARPRLRPAPGLRTGCRALRTLVSSRRRTSSPTCRRTCIDAAALHFLLDLARECGVEARRDAMFARRADQRHRGPRGAAHRAARAARGSGGPGRGAWRRSTRCSRMPRASATPRPAASPTSSTSASAAATSGRRWRCRRSTVSAIPRLRLHFVSNVDGHDLMPRAAQAAAGKARCSSSRARPSPPRRR